MRRWTFPIHLEPASSEPVYLQIARAISGDVRRGRLKPGDPLPGSRTLAATLGVHRNTVLAAYRELEAEGWTETAQRTTRVARDLPSLSGRIAAKTRSGLAFPLPAPTGPAPLNPPAARPGTLVFGGGLPDLRLVPTELIGRAYGRALRHRDLLGYGDVRGDARLRAALAEFLSEWRGLALGPEHLLVSSGSQMALELVGRKLLQPGDRVAVEDPGYPPAWATLRAAGAELVPVPVDEGGLRVDALESELKKGTLRALYTTPHHQFPTTATMSAARRMRLLELARHFRLAILEDDYDFEFHFDGNPVLPLASAALDRVVYMGTLSKVLAPGLRVGFIAGAPALVEALAARRLTMDRQGDLVLQRAVAELVEDGLLRRHARKMRRVYQARRDLLAGSLHRHLPDAVSFDLPPGGMSLWLRAAEDLDVEAWSHRALGRGVVFYPGRRFDFRGRSLPNLRLGFSTLDEAELEEAVRRMKQSL